jgi:acetyl-CoA carboxylase biotin carboxylase subunit
MRVVRDAAGLPEAVAGARREAQASFGDPTVFLERYLERARHVEVQVFGDTRGDVVHLFERECSVQRRHQKVIEESPSPGATATTLERMYDAASALARAIGYVGAGTVEFLVSGEGEAQEFFFLEMNTRIQVEHPVTEMITGVDIVREQIRIADGKKLRYAQKDVQLRGHAIEVRINAEDPETFLPFPGPIDACVFPGGFGVRVDTAIYPGYTVPSTYDSLLGKLIVHGDDRGEAIMRMRRALDEIRIAGVRTTVPFHKKIMVNSDFVEARLSTNFLERQRP